MFEMVKNSAVLFFQGKLFANTPRAMVQLLIGIAISTGAFLACAFVGWPLAVAGLIAGVAGGVLQPVLFKDLRYR
jgi:uncharacterized membrane protein